MDEWISVKYRLPDKDGEYLCYGFLEILSATGTYPESSYQICVFVQLGGGWQTDPVWTTGITHWLQRPGARS